MERRRAGAARCVARRPAGRPSLLFRSFVLRSLPAPGGRAADQLARRTVPCRVPPRQPVGRPIPSREESSVRHAVAAQLFGALLIMLKTRVIPTLLLRGAG